jgi:hypothetical protein
MSQPLKFTTDSNNSNGEECLSWTCVFEWCKCFREGREHMENEPHDRRPRSSVTEPNTDCADVLLRENRCIPIKELGGMLSISVGSVEDIVKKSISAGSVEDIVKNHLHYCKVNAWAVVTVVTVVGKAKLMSLK